MRAGVLLVGILAGGLAVAADAPEDVTVVELSPAPAAPPPGCALAQEAVDPRSETCLACHTPCKHPRDLDYARAQALSWGGLPMRRAQDVVARGVALPDGEVRCVTCHDPRSPWKCHLALPAGSTPTPEVVLGDRRTYEDGPERAALTAALQAPNPLRRPAVSPKPLCLACHAAD